MFKGFGLVLNLGRSCGKCLRTGRLTSSGLLVDPAGNLTKLRGVSRSFDASINEINAAGVRPLFDGNPKTYEAHTLKWDEENRMTEYDGSTTTYFYYDLSGFPVLEEQSGSITAINTFGPNGLISRGTSPTNEVYYQFDERGNTVTRSNASGAALGYHGSDTYGIQFAYDPTDGSDPYLGFGAQWGYYRDSEIVFLLLGHRIYDPGHGRFLNRDPIGYAGGINPYSYASNSPTGLIDPSGFDSEPWYDGLASWFADKVQVAKNFYSQELGGLPGGWAVAGTINTGIDLVGGLAQVPASIGHLGSGLGAYAGCQSEENAIEAWGDIGTAASLALGGMEGFEYMNRPYWRYVYEGSRPSLIDGVLNDDVWLTRGRGYGAPYGSNWSAARDALSLPKTPDAAISIRAPWNRFTGWGRRVDPVGDFGTSGGGAEYRTGGYK